MLKIQTYMNYNCNSIVVKSRVAIIISIIITLVSCKIINIPTSTHARYNKFENMILDDINSKRPTNKKLKIGDEFTNKITIHGSNICDSLIKGTKDTSKFKVSLHDGFKTRTKQGYNCGEVIACDFYEKETEEDMIESLVISLFESRKHKKMLLDQKYKNISISFIRKKTATGVTVAVITCMLYD